MTDEPNPSNETEGHVITWDINKAAIAEAAKEMEWIDAYTDLPAAKAAKKKLQKMRTNLDAAHKATKAEALAFGKLCDTKKNEYLALIRAIEDPISEDLDKIKNAEAVAEQARIDEIMLHINRLQAYSLDRHSLTLGELQERRENLLTEVIDPEMYQEMAEDAQLSKDEADLKLRLAIDRETTRLAEEEEKERIEAENKELRDKLAKAEEEEAERNRVAREEQERRDTIAREEQAAIDAEKQADLDEQQAAIDAEKKKIRDENEAQAKADAKAKADAEAAELAALQAPDVVKLEKYAEAVDHLIGLKPVMGSNAGNAVLLDVVHGLIGVHTLLTNNIEEMK